VVHSHEYGKSLTGPNHTPVFYTLNTGVWFGPVRRFAVFMRENFQVKKINEPIYEANPQSTTMVNGCFREKPG
jgi:hypothetical protein